MKKFVGTILTLAMLVGCLGIVAMASEADDSLALSGEQTSAVTAVQMTTATPVAIQGPVTRALNRDTVLSIEDMQWEALDADSMITADIVQTRATNSVSWNISAGKTMRATSAFSLEANETVTLNLSYSPNSASVDFGLIAPNGLFYYVNSSNGSINQTVQVTTRGQYYLAIRNNSNNIVSVVGYINY